MTGDSQPADENGAPGQAPAPAKSRAQLAREARLAEALRENLRRRKAQARGRKTPPPGAEG